uniref:EF-hand domain-containing protein n=1 Tax=Polytomella parva TaxID=51329 RepID=A0A7S0URD2_9CHLO|mmetsp:Transcript_18797/g.34116  ORF Transcript_18797/g.34116 Transcript_18797/m.34116 type:complete len:169 (+) Transcript_18797:163-669(+)|eukprot:CAMPEP_0175085050 /NCGR_PEP_ID=MMETSP0052_2-20121109/28428_1 /TAXON_ID=51329 ORGANISM="Polytomella parva, Strain SAG 63-3" /NCGR_SAMPLE_ID=MMETSP0052_2 /ASSEMBLY_ACC=CAM_ASM_000194 /LENGTH=168 /DNA_ID=CAMNT_0016356979 /DNA_START=56 /DNA_END=562 /DNA_ORIENTATION=-
MGNDSSRPVAGKLSPSEVDRVSRRFHRLPLYKGKAKIGELADMAEIGGNPIMYQVLRAFDAENSGYLSLEMFVSAIEFFCQLKDIDSQYSFAFRLYDQDKDGFISLDELQNTLRTLVGHRYPGDQLDEIAKSTLTVFDEDCDGKLSFAEFKSLLTSSDLQSRMAPSFF